MKLFLLPTAAVLATAAKFEKPSTNCTNLEAKCSHVYKECLLNHPCDFWTAPHNSKTNCLEIFEQKDRTLSYPFALTGLKDSECFCGVYQNEVHELSRPANPKKILFEEWATEQNIPSLVPEVLIDSSIGPYKSSFSCWPLSYILYDQFWGSSASEKK